MVGGVPPSRGGKRATQQRQGDCGKDRDRQGTRGDGTRKEEGSQATRTDRTASNAAEEHKDSQGRCTATREPGGLRDVRDHERGTPAQSGTRGAGRGGAEGGEDVRRRTQDKRRKRARGRLEEVVLAARHDTKARGAQHRTQEAGRRRHHNERKGRQRYG